MHTSLSHSSQSLDEMGATKSPILLNIEPGEFTIHYIVFLNNYIPSKIKEWTTSLMIRIMHDVSQL